MSYRSAIRSYQAAARRAQRERDQRMKTAARQYKQQQKAQELQSASQAVDEYNNYVELLQGLHKDASEEISWTELMNQPRPEKPELSNENEVKAQEALDSYKPSFSDKLFGGQKKMQAQLEQELEAAKQKDAGQYAEDMKEYEEDLNSWETLQNIAKGILQNDYQFYPKALEYFQPFSGVQEIGSELKFKFSDNGNVEIELKTKSKDAVPDYSLSLTASGKLSKKAIPVSKFNELYQDYVCGCILRVARETYSVLPIQKLLVHAIAEQLNSATGHIEDQVIVSTFIPAKTLTVLNFENIDTSDAMKNFNTNMKFSKTNGFVAVEKVVAPEV